MDFQRNKAVWKNTTSGYSKKFVCYNCGVLVASNELFYTNDGYNHRNGMIYICPHCNAPNVFDAWEDRPEAQYYGEDVKKLPETILSVYNEIRKCIGVNAYTAATMMLRKILMNFAVENGAKEGDSFHNYVQWLCKEGYVHKLNHKQAEAIKKLGNKSNHKIESINKEDCLNIFNFVVHFLKSNYEFADEDEIK